MHVIAHEAISKNGAIPLAGVGGKQAKIRVNVFITKEHRFSVVASVHDMVRESGGHGSGYSGHRSVLH
jgi:hypothetical protein